MKVNTKLKLVFLFSLMVAVAFVHPVLWLLMDLVLVANFDAAVAWVFDVDYRCYEQS